MMRLQLHQPNCFTSVATALRAVD